MSRTYTKQNSLHLSGASTTRGPSSNRGSLDGGGTACRASVSSAVPRDPRPPQIPRRDRRPIQHSTHFAQGNLTPTPAQIIAATAQSCLRAVNGLGVGGFTPSDRLWHLAGVEGTFAHSNHNKTAPRIHFWSKLVTGISSRCQIHSRQLDTLQYMERLAGRPRLPAPTQQAAHSAHTWVFSSGYRYDAHLNIILVH